MVIRNSLKGAKTNRDIFSKKKRSQIMSAIRSKNTKLEEEIFKVLKLNDIKFKKHCKGIVGRPDIVIPLDKKVVFLDSDFWHGWRFPVWRSKLTSDFWINKIEANRRRDGVVTRKLRSQGWHVLRVWSHQLKKNEKEKTIKKILNFLT